MNLPDEEMAKFVTASWLKRVADVPLEEVAVMVCEDPSVVTALIGALRHARKQLEMTPDEVKALRLVPAGLEDLYATYRIRAVVDGTAEPTRKTIDIAIAVIHRLVGAEP